MKDKNLNLRLCYYTILLVNFPSLFYSYSAQNLDGNLANVGKLL